LDVLSLISKQLQIGDEYMELNINKMLKVLGKIPGIDLEKVQIIKEKIKKEYEGNPPRIALIGETGVGKSSTINVLFNQGLEISHTVPCTKEPEELEPEEFNVNIEEYICSKGTIIIIDMPGLGEDIETDELHKKAYFKILPSCDVAVWVLKADVRTMTQVQVYLRDVVGPAMGGFDKLVIGLNQVDTIQPGKWDENKNIPSLEQQDSIGERIDDISKKIRRICPIEKDCIIPYSALMRYRLENLFRAMIDACPQKRAWVLERRRAIADYNELIDPEYIRKIATIENVIQEGGI